MTNIHLNTPFAFEDLAILFSSEVGSSYKATVSNEAHFVIFEIWRR